MKVIAKKNHEAFGFRIHFNEVFDNVSVTKDLFGRRFFTLPSVSDCVQWDASMFIEIEGMPLEANLNYFIMS